MKIALYPGSFNPVHRGHVELACSVLSEKLADEVWMIVSPHNPLKDKSNQADEKDRMAMLQIALEKYPDIRASDVEFSLPRPSYTINTLDYLVTRFPEHHFVLMIGSDNALVFNQWKDYEVILQRFQVYVYPRRGFPLTDAIQFYPQMHALETPFYDISSTAIREMISQNEDTTQWLHPLVREYIIQRGLYR